MRSTVWRVCVTVGVCLAIVLALSVIVEAKKKDVVEISQEKVLDGGITPGDTAGFPATISESGSYKLISNLEVPDANTTAIYVIVDNVTLDLNGFAIIGPNVCDMSTGCDPGGFGTGINAFGKDNISVRNGIVTGMGRYGIFTGSLGTIEDVHATNNGTAGIRVSTGSTVAKCTSSSNGGYGIEVSAGLVSNCSVDRNGSYGILGTGGSTVTNCVVQVNGGTGISANGNVTNNNLSRNGLSFTSPGISTQGNVIGNTVVSSTGNGIETVNVGSLVKDNTVMFNDGDGIHDNNGASTVIGNHISVNKGYGLNLHAESGYVNNVIKTLTGTSIGTVLGGVQMGTNLCDGVPCP